jgi:hypothetical protein
MDHRFDDSAWPLLHLTFSAKPTDLQWARYLSETEQFLARGETFAMIYEVRQPQILTVRQVRMQVDWLARHEGELGRLCVGAAMVLYSPAHRGVLRVLMGLRRLPTDVHVCGSVDDGRAWARGRLAAVGAA